LLEVTDEYRVRDSSEFHLLETLSERWQVTFLGDSRETRREFETAQLALPSSYLASRMTAANFTRLAARLAARRGAARRGAPPTAYLLIINGAMTRTPYYKWRVMKQLFTPPPTRHLAERGRDPARVGDDVDVGYATARRRVDAEREQERRQWLSVSRPGGIWPLAVAAPRSRGWAVATLAPATAPSYDTAIRPSRGGPPRSPSRTWASSASTCSTASCISWIRQRRPTLATRPCE